MNAPIKKYRCTFCDRAFSRSEHRTRHERSHTQERPFQCTKCSSSFVRRDLLLRHDRTVHNENKPKKEDRRKSSVGNIHHQQIQQQQQQLQHPQQLAQAHPLGPQLGQPQLGQQLPPQPQQQPIAQEHPHPHALAPPAPHNGLKEPLRDPTLHSPAHTQHSPVDVKQQPKVDMSMFGGFNTASPSTQHDKESLSTLAEAAGREFEYEYPHRYPSPLNYDMLYDQELSAANLITDLGRKKNVNIPGIDNINNAIFGEAQGREAANGETQHVTSMHVRSASETFGMKTDPISAQPSPPLSASAATTGVAAAGPSTVNPPHTPPAPIVIPQFAPHSPPLSTLLSAVSQYEIKKSGLRFLPSKGQLNRYLSVYFTCYHMTTPIIHPQSFNPQTASPALLFAVCAMGALFASEIEMSKKLNDLSCSLRRTVFEQSEMSWARPVPIWATQTLLINVSYEMRVGDEPSLSFVEGTKTLLSNLVTQRVVEVENLEFGWSNWIMQESSRRTYFAVFVLYGTMTCLFNHGPAIWNANVRPNLTLPCSESLWNASFSSEQEWLQAYSQTVPPQTFRSSLEALCGIGDTSSSHYGLRILGTALFFEVWELKKREGANNHNRDAQEMAQNGSYTGHLGRALLKWQHCCKQLPPTVSGTVDLFASERLMIMIRAIIESSINPSTVSSVSLFRAHPMILEGHILTILSSIKLHSPPRQTLSLATFELSHCEELMVTETKIIEKCFELFHVPLLCGSQIFQSFMLKPLTFGMIDENIVSTFEICLVFIVWIDSIEKRIGRDLSTRELILWNTVQTSLIDSGIELSCHELAKRHGDPNQVTDMLTYSYAGGFAYFWADVLSALDTWGMAKVLSKSLCRIGKGLTERSVERRRSSTGT
ncbi:Transcriptional regulator of form adherence 5 [Yarrowia sp. B02]|nr:Transcriptional regulator of form adherence 5 [Yarrowia sp. B02]